MILLTSHRRLRLQCWKAFESTNSLQIKRNISALFIYSHSFHATFVLKYSPSNAPLKSFFTKWLYSFVSQSIFPLKKQSCLPIFNMAIMWFRRIIEWRCIIHKYIVLNFHLMNWGPNRRLSADSCFYWYSFNSTHCLLHHCLEKECTGCRQIQADHPIQIMEYIYVWIMNEIHLLNNLVVQFMLMVGRAIKNMNVFDNMHSHIQVCQQTISLP